MEEILVRISEYQKAMGYDFENMTLQARMQAFRNYVFALAVEQAELATELPIKPWRPYKDQLYSAPEVLAEEWVDCLFFLVDQALVLQLPHDVIRKAFEDKMTKNYKRIKDGYNG